MTPGEASAIQSIWKDLHAPGADGGDGPLGCPIGKPVVADPGKHSWKGVKQSFQRGWILIGRGSSAGSQVAMIRGLDSWTIWWKGLPGLVLPALQSATTHHDAAKWPRGGTVFVTYRTPSDEASLLTCPTHQVYSSWSISTNGCTQLTPVLALASKPFDAAAHLDENLLTTPQVGALRKRIDALFADWLPCHTQTLMADEVGEDAFERAMIMMRRDSPCPLTGRIPSVDVKQWLSGLSFPAEMLPGTTSKDSDCPRTGELDVTLVELLRLTLKHRAALSTPTFDHVKGLLNPWGVAARRTPYVTADNTHAHLCYGFGFIETENHMLLEETAAYLINSMMGRDRAGNRDWILAFLTQIARRDFYEFNSIPYSRYQLKALYVLHDYAPDEEVRTVAKGLLGWIFAKQAVSGNLDRDHRPYRRSYEDKYLVPPEWWGSSATPITTATALFAGPLQHANSDVDLQYDNGQHDAVRVLTNVGGFPDLAAAPAQAAAALVDAASTGYRLPEALAGWLERRYTSEESNRTTYLQAINHVPKSAENLAVFRQANSGAEMVSGNRNWTMIGGGAPAPPGDPGPPPLTNASEMGITLGGVGLGGVVGGLVGGGAGAIVGAVLGGYGANKGSKEYAADKQEEALWDTQAGTIRETTLIPTPIALNRSQTVRFGRSVVTEPVIPPIPNITPGRWQIARLCVAEGFMCGFDLRQPVRPFPDAADALRCPWKDQEKQIPPALITAFLSRAGPGQTVTSALGCLTNPSKGFLPNGNWSIWSFERGMLAFGEYDIAGSERFAGAWIERQAGQPSGGRLRVAWNIRGDGYDWFRVHSYSKSVAPRGGEPPGGWMEPLLVVGDAGDRTKESDGDTGFNLEKAYQPSWDVLIVGCKKKYFLFALTGHRCVDDKMPRLTVNVGPVPRQSFACAVHDPPPAPLSHTVPRPEGIVMEVGSCKGGPYGLFLYVWSAPCPPGTRVNFCPEGAIDYGFVVAAPSRGFRPEEFRSIVEDSMNSWRASGHGYFPGMDASIDVPISPPVVRGTTGWMPTAAPSKHSVKFRWPIMNGAAILGDTAAPGLFDPASLGGAPSDWPTAVGHVSAPDSTGISGALIRNFGTGCFTLSGFPTPSDPNPMGLLVDFRNLAAPVVKDRLTSDLATLCS